METRLARQDNPSSRWTSPFHQAYLLSLVVLSLVACEKKEDLPPPAPPSVRVVDVIQQDVPTYSEWVAQLNGDTNAQIMPKVQGYVLKQNYKDGFPVRVGQLLFEIDPRPFQASLDQANAQKAVAEAELSRAETDRARDTPLAAQNAIPQKQLDNDISAEAAGKAQVQAANAMIDQAKLNCLDEGLFSHRWHLWSGYLAGGRPGGPDHEDDHYLEGESDSCVLLNQ